MMKYLNGIAIALVALWLMAALPGEGSGGMSMIQPVFATGGYGGDSGDSGEGGDTGGGEGRSGVIGGGEGGVGCVDRDRMPKGQSCGRKKPSRFIIDLIK